MKRLFVALKIQPTPAISTLFHHLKSHLSRERIKWVNPKGLHLTLAFLGETPGTAMPQIQTVLEEVGRAHPPLGIQLKGLGAFPSRKRPRILWAGVAGDPGLFALQRQLVQTIDPIVKINDRRFAPHLTLGRIKGGVGNPGYVNQVLHRHRAWCDAPLDMAEFVLMESKLRPQGPLYTIVKSHGLTG